MYVPTMWINVFCSEVHLYLSSRDVHVFDWPAMFSSVYLLGCCIHISEYLKYLPEDSADRAAATGNQQYFTNRCRYAMRYVILL